ncbi:MAG: hypothetical protein ACPGUD_14475 [Parashewanella sp.]
MAPTAEQNDTSSIDINNVYGQIEQLQRQYAHKQTAYRIGFSKHYQVVIIDNDQSHPHFQRFFEDEQRLLTLLNTHQAIKGKPSALPTMKPSVNPPLLLNAPVLLRPVQQQPADCSAVEDKKIIHKMVMRKIAFHLGFMRILLYRNKSIETSLDYILQQIKSSSDFDEFAILYVDVQIKMIKNLEKFNTDQLKPLYDQLKSIYDHILTALESKRQQLQHSQYIAPPPVQQQAAVASNSRFTHTLKASIDTPPVCRIALIEPLETSACYLPVAKAATINLILTSYRQGATGLPVRCISDDDIKYFKKVDAEIGSEKDSLALYRPVTCLYSDARIRLHSNNKCVVIFDPNEIDPFCIFKKNANTNQFESCKQTRRDILRLADNRVKMQNTKRLTSLEALKYKTEEKRNREASLDKQVTTDSHFDLTSHSWTARIPRARFTRQASYQHNEVVAKPITSHAIIGTIHYLAPNCSSDEPLNPFVMLRTRYLQHLKITEHLQRQIPFIVYSPNRGGILEICDTQLSIPERTHIKVQDNALYQHSLNSLELYCRLYHLKLTFITELLIRTPVDKQFAFILSIGASVKEQSRNQYKLATSKNHLSREQLLIRLWESSIKPCPKLHTPLKVVETSQQLLRMFCYQPRSLAEFKECIKQNKLPQNLNDPTRPIAIMMSALVCEWYCILLETQGIELSHIEKLLLTYITIIVNGSCDTPTAVTKFTQLFSNSISAKFLSLFSNIIAKDITVFEECSRERLLKHIIEFCTYIPKHCKGTNDGHISDAWLQNTDMLTVYTSMPTELLNKPQFKALLLSAINATTNIMQLSGMNMLTDMRKQQRCDARYQLNPLSAEFDQNRNWLMKTSENLWLSLHQLMAENFKRELCLLAETPVIQTIQLRALPIPDKLTVLDLLTIQQPDVQKNLEPLIKHIKKHKLARPTYNLSVVQSAAVRANLLANETFKQEQDKIPPQTLLDAIDSYSEQQKTTNLQLKQRWLKMNKKEQRDQPTIKSPTKPTTEQSVFQAV